MSTRIAPARPTPSAFPARGTYTARALFLIRKASRHIDVLQNSACDTAKQQKKEALEAAKSWEEKISEQAFEHEVARADWGLLEKQIQELELQTEKLELGKPIVWASRACALAPSLKSDPSSLQPQFVLTPSTHNLYDYATIKSFKSRTWHILRSFRTDLDNSLHEELDKVNVASRRLRLDLENWRKRMLAKNSKYEETVHAAMKHRVDRNLEVFDRNIEKMRLFDGFKWPVSDIFSRNLKSLASPTLHAATPNTRSPLVQQHVPTSPAPQPPLSFAHPQEANMPWDERGFVPTEQQEPVHTFGGKAIAGYNQPYLTAGPHDGFGLQDPATAHLAPLTHIPALGSPRTGFAPVSAAHMSGHIDSAWVGNTGMTSHDAHMLFAPGQYLTPQLAQQPFQSGGVYPHASSPFSLQGRYQFPPPQPIFQSGREAQHSLSQESQDDPFVYDYFAGQHDGFGYGGAHHSS
ncbi:hypothetical protein JCM10908_006640 [Rhodotorula pacifica]|uniref:uncharacterized protein n=1 Tax=Rhodotorula pacifica TaxID=1495444 RepID=UPI00317735DD